MSNQLDVQNLFPWNPGVFSRLSFLISGCRERRTFIPYARICVFIVPVIGSPLEGLHVAIHHSNWVYKMCHKSRVRDHNLI